MISKLPNDLVQHIMSFLSMREAVRTSVLSHWWVNQWTFLKSIQLNIYWFHMDREKFSSFLDKLLLSRVQADAPMDTFELKSFAIDRANCWINHAIKHNAKVLKFAEYGKWEPFYLDPNLVELSSRYLETLELTNVALDATIFSQLANSCPALQNMLLTDCLLEVEEISSSSLKNLDIIDCYILKDLSICTPSLVSLCIKNERTDNSSFRNSYIIFATVIIIDASSVSSMELLAMDRQVRYCIACPVALILSPKHSVHYYLFHSFTICLVYAFVHYYHTFSCEYIYANEFSFITRTQHKTFILHGMYIPDFNSTHISLTTYFTTIFFIS